MEYKIISNRIVKSLIRNKIIQTQYEEIFSYGLQKKLLLLNSMVIYLIFGALTGQIMNVLVFISFYALLRRVTGGIHANKYNNCLLSFMCIMSMGFFIADILFKQSSKKYVMVFFLILAVYLVYRYAPVECDNKKFTDSVRLLLRRRALITIFIQIVIICLISQMEDEFQFYSLLATIAIFLQAVTLAPLTRKIVTKFSEEFIEVMNILQGKKNY